MYPTTILLLSAYILFEIIKLALSRFKIVKKRQIKFVATKNVNKDLLSNMKYDFASGFDIESAADKILSPGKSALIDTGLIIEIPNDLELQIRPRSGWSHRNRCLVNFGTIDSDYRGKIKISVMNLGNAPIHIEKGDRIAQGVFAKKVITKDNTEFIRVDSIDDFDIPETSRGEGGFGSSGV